MVDIVEEYFDSLGTDFSILDESKEYSSYVKGHIKNLKSGYRWMKKYMPELFPKGFFNETNRKIRKSIKTHDKSKWGKEEYKSYEKYDDYIHGRKAWEDGGDETKRNFDKAWNHHQKSNPHHWQYWVVKKWNGEDQVLDMPYENIIEMICDWWTFSWKENNLKSIFDWYQKNKNYMILSPATRNKVESILSRMKTRINELEKEGKMLKESYENLNEWSLSDFDTPEKIQAEISRLETAKKKDGMPSFYYESIDKQLKQLRTKLNGPLEESRLPKDGSNPEFGVPEEKKYPLFDENHVRSAIKLFGHVNPKYESTLAHAIIRKMKKYNISSDVVGEDNELYKYLTESTTTDVLNAIRADLQGELTAIKDYDEHADLLDTNGIKDGAKILRDIRDEEKVHIGELQTILQKYDKEYGTSIASGTREGEEALDESEGYKEADSLGGETDALYKKLISILKENGGKETPETKNIEKKLEELNKKMKEISKENLSESVLDPVQKTRCTEIFDENDKMLDSVKEHIKTSFQFWYDQLNPEQKSFDIVGYKMIGSSTGYNYTAKSDMDVQVYVKMKEGHEFKETYKLIKILPNGHNLPETLHPINYFMVDVENPTEMKNVENLYNIETGEWEKKSDKPELSIPSEYIREITRFLTDGFDLLLGRYQRDKQYLEDAYALDPEKQEISEKEKADEVVKRTTQLQADIDALWLAEHLIHGFRLEAYNDNNPFHILINYMSDDPRSSTNELIYKTLDKFEYREKLRSTAKEGYDFLQAHKEEDVAVEEAEEIGDLFDIIEEEKDTSEDLSELFENEFSDDLSALFDDFKDTDAEKVRIEKVIKEIEPVEYGFISKKDGSRITDRDWIHNCKKLSEYYNVQTNPEVTLKEKLGICTDQSLAVKYLFEKYYPEMHCEMYALTTGRFGHCVPCFEDAGKWYYLENAWDKEKGLHGSFDSEGKMKDYLASLYHKHHDAETGFAPVKVRTYSEYLRESYSLNESINWF